MANEVNDGSDKVERINRGDRTSENTSKDSIIGGFRKDHQQIHQEASKAGLTFETFSDNDDDQSFKAIQPAADAFGIDFGDGTVETAKGKMLLAQKSDTEPVTKRNLEHTAEKEVTDGKSIAKSNWELLYQFLTGSGADVQLHNKPDDPMLKSFRKSPGAQAIRKQ